MKTKKNKKTRTKTKNNSRCWHLPGGTPSKLQKRTLSNPALTNILHLLKVSLLLERARFKTKNVEQQSSLQPYTTR